MKLSVPTWTMPSLTLEEVSGVARSLGFDGLDVGLFYASAVDKEQILGDPEGAAEAARAQGLPLANYYHLFGEDLEDRNLARPGDRVANLRDLERVARFCAAAKIPTLFVLPGMLNPGQTTAAALDAAGTTLREGREVAAAAGVQLIFEPHVHSIVESPAATLTLLERAPGVQLALDYAHFVCLGFSQPDIDPLLEHAGHVHLRQARAGRLQERSPYGTINFNTLLSMLRESGYDGWIAPEPLHQDYIDSWNVDVLTELVAVRDLARRWYA